MALLSFCPVCLGVVLWAALDLNGSYPTVKPPVPAGWQAVAGIYASFSAPKSWSLQQGLSDANGDVFYSGPGGGAGESVTEATTQPDGHQVPAIVKTFLGGAAQVAQRTPYRLRNAAVAWRYLFRLGGGGRAIGLMAWCRETQSEVWLVAAPASRTAGAILLTLTLAT